MPAAFGLSVKAFKAGFFDRRAVLDPVQKVAAKAQGKWGAYARAAMRNSIKYKARGADGKSPTAPPGSPPFAHASAGFTSEKKDRKTGAVSRQARSPLRELIFFARDPVTKAVVAGPALFGRGGAGALERGGDTTTRDPRTGGTKTVHVRPHPFARPAGEKANSKFAELMRAAVQ